ncbi:hypothetical protein GSS88_11295 [Corynebacterium sp. 3HC-13]|uniref:hypothetical protein n=1 Tax=Corynebacterium poyangense TaxID=2684405 RepID=UPI001CCE5521|nr:hypothetical protein [Corynebacterium poyangense]MBZ8178362.1 hypothetical protein [Corynebacterium poyangense]
MKALAAYKPDTVKGIRNHRYLLSEMELFARSYAQWVGVKTGEKRINQVIALQKEGDGMWAYTQWDTKDFADNIVPALDELFSKIYP